MGCEKHMGATRKALLRLCRRVVSPNSHKPMLHFSWSPLHTHCSRGPFEDNSFPCVHILCRQHFPARCGGASVIPALSRQKWEEASLVDIVNSSPPRATQLHHVSKQHITINSLTFRCVKPTSLQLVKPKVHNSPPYHPWVLVTPTNRLMCTVVSILTFPGRHQHRHDLLVKVASFLCILRPVLGQNCNLVLGFSAHLPFFGYIFS